MIGTYVCVAVFFFFFKQKTAYEMRISDWSSDVCSSDLYGKARPGQRRRAQRAFVEAGAGVGEAAAVAADHLMIGHEVMAERHRQIGRESCRESVCQYV